MTCQANSESMSSCEAWTDLALDLRAVEQRGVALATPAIVLGLDVLEGLEPAPDLHHAHDVRLDELQGRRPPW